MRDPSPPTNGRIILPMAEGALKPSTAVWRRGPVVRLLAICLMAEIGYATLNLSTMPVYLTGDRHFGQGVMGLVLTAFLLAEALFKTPMGHLADRLGPRMLMALGPAVSVVTSLLSLLVPHMNAGPLEVLAFVVLRGLDGLAIAMLWPAAFAQMNATVNDADRQQSMSLLNSCYLVGIALAFPVGGIVNDLAGEEWAAIILAAALFLGVSLAAWFLVPARKVETSTADEAHGSVGIAGFVASMRQIPEYLILSAITFMGIGFPTFIFKLFPRDQFGFSETQIGAAIFPGAIALGLASVPMSRFGEKMGRVRAVHLGLGLAAAGMAVIATGMFVPPLRQPWMLALGGLPVGIGFLLTVPAWLASVSDLDPRRRGANLGAVMTAQGLGAIVGAPVGALLYEKLQPLGKALHLGAGFGRYSPFLACAVALGIGWLLSIKILHERRPSGAAAPDENLVDEHGNRVREADGHPPEAEEIFAAPGKPLAEADGTNVSDLPRDP
ncbi:MFS transporter [bacterium]|nr:MAG: MFS transporter [bacterium]